MASKGGSWKSGTFAPVKMQAAPTQTASTEELRQTYLKSMEGGGARERMLKRYMREGRSKDLGNLNLEEYAALRYYTTYGYSNINTLLRGGDLSYLSDRARRNFELDGRFAASALQKLPPHTGTVYRGIGVSQSVISSIRVGETYTDKGFMSTSARADRRRSGNLQFEINATGKNARDLSRLSSYRGEREVLYPPGSRFTVTGKRTEGRSTIVQLMEI
ncbi:hypothetical protein IQ268_08985 [Oculatella sp. LEGE 06141]|uniref:ADP-ribosyltransferase n=1 Tax=Oculatella sp. LEGE 06141 TaxID=1828648 RepID=UPI00187FA695|nr:ADP-ribosyltransferase [Oculatella sp. LEGE 06141]MBE9178693.1 hypothetical protein [Oculatella sp. LEGE 06141]